MGYDYALVHLKYTIPPAIILTLLYKPFLTRLDVYKLAFLIGIAFFSTLPWDAYLIHRKIWSYPSNAILGPTLLSIPAEELFFFVVQTYITSFLYFILSKPTFHPPYLLWKIDPKTVGDTSRFCVPSRELRAYKTLGQCALAAVTLAGASMIWNGGTAVYLGLILVWAGPFALFLWSLAYQFILALPYTSTIAPIAVPSLYLWIIDTLALKRGTWVIESGTKLGLHLWDGLEIEEAVFFVATNTLIVFGLLAFDNALAVIQAFPSLFPTANPVLPLPRDLVKALLTDSASHDYRFLQGINEAVERLRKKSRSFYFASAVFEGPLRIDLIFLYSFCRVADDLVDDASEVSIAKSWITKLEQFLDMAYSHTEPSSQHPQVRKFVQSEFPVETQSALLQLPVSRLSPKPIYDLLDGFKTDLDFRQQSSPGGWAGPISSETDLETYSWRVAGTVAELCLELAFHHTTYSVDFAQQVSLASAGGQMGVALQYVNIARDIAFDAKVGRVYLPKDWLDMQGITHAEVLKSPEGPKIENLRRRLLRKANERYEAVRRTIEELPPDCRAPMRVAVESYMEIGRVLQEGRHFSGEGKASVPRLRRLVVGWKAMMAN
ncbi:MAG: hypothetical protein M1829_003892 [Trizodia sp. TS-e1964]|nr:MAG: hypothetical protein M1829_003892 [Trizodia sp. TS-e1964]